MNKNKVTGILYGFIICLCIAIFILIIKLSLRTDTEMQSSSVTGEESGVIVQEGSIDENIEDVAKDKPENVVNKELEEKPAVLEKKVKAKQTVNIRAKAEASSEKLGVLNEGDQLDLVEVLDNGWTQVRYNDQDAFIKSEYLEVLE